CAFLATTRNPPGGITVLAGSVKSIPATNLQPLTSAADCPLRLYNSTYSSSDRPLNGRYMISLRITSERNPGRALTWFVGSGVRAGVGVTACQRSAPLGT